MAEGDKHGVGVSLRCRSRWLSDVILFQDLAGYLTNDHMRHESRLSVKLKQSSGTGVVGKAVRKQGYLNEAETERQSIGYVSAVASQLQLVRPSVQEDCFLELSAYILLRSAAGDAAACDVQCVSIESNT